MPIIGDRLMRAATMLMACWPGAIVATHAARFLSGESEMQNKHRDKGAGESAWVHRGISLRGRERTS